MSDVDIVANVLALLLPFLLLGVLWIFTLRIRRRRGDDLVKQRSITRSVTALMAVLVIAVLVSGTLGRWSPESALIPLGWLVTGLAIGLLVWLFRR